MIVITPNATREIALSLAASRGERLQFVQKRKITLIMAIALNTKGAGIGKAIVRPGNALPPKAPKPEK